jgi:hypothetical protein
MIRHGRFHDEKGASDHDDMEREDRIWGALVIAIGIIAALIFAWHGGWK